MTSLQSWYERDLIEQLGGAVDTLIRLSNRCREIKNKLAEHVERGEGLTQEQLVEVYAEMDKVLGGRKRKAPSDPQTTGTTLDTPL